MRVVRALPIAMALAAAVLAVAALPSRPPRIDRVILLGFDGAAPNLIQPLVEAGQLPALQRLMRTGAYGPLRTFKPTKSAILWTSVATGKTMLKHGIVDWTYVDREGLEVPYEDRSRRVKTYWEILGERGVSTGTLNWWMSYPPRPVARGYVVSNAFRHRQRPDTVYPPQLFQLIKDRILPYPEGVDAEMRRRGVPRWREEDAQTPLGHVRNAVLSYGFYFAQDVSVDRASDRLFERRPVQVFSTYFRLVDVTSHFAAHYVDRDLLTRTERLEAEGRLTQADVQRMDREFARVVAPAYRFMDAIVAKYLGRLDGHTALIVCSDHGFQYYKGSYSHAASEMEPPDGALFMAGPGVRRGAHLTGATLFDIAPTILYWMGQAVARDMDGTALLAALEPTYATRQPMTFVDSYETSAGAQPAAGAQDVRQDVLRDLRALGYVDSGGGPSASATPSAPPQGR